MLHVTLALPQVRAERSQRAINHSVKWKNVELYYVTNNMTDWIIINNREGPSSSEPVRFRRHQFLICRLLKF
jgi:hypothetical protein